MHRTVCVAWLIAVLPLLAVAESAKMNVVFILGDDRGWTDAGLV